MTDAEREECLARIRVARLRGDFMEPPTEEECRRSVECSMALAGVALLDGWWRK